VLLAILTVGAACLVLIYRQSASESHLLQILRLLNSQNSTKQSHSSSSSSSSSSVQEYMFQDFKRDYDEAVYKMRGGDVPIDGSIHSTNRAELAFFLSRDPSIKTVCETGFNVGTSTYIWLSSPHIEKVWSFDLNIQIPTKKMAHDYLQNKFPGKLFVTEGDSTKTLPKFVDTHPDVECDLIFVDGGHIFDIPELDLRNMRRMTPKTGAFVLADDYGDCPYCLDVKRGWDKLVKEGNLLSLGCLHTCFGGFVTGYTNCENPIDHYMCMGRFSAVTPKDRSHTPTVS